MYYIYITYILHIYITYILHTNYIKITYKLHINYIYIICVFFHAVATRTYNVPAVASPLQRSFLRVAKIRLTEISYWLHEDYRLVSLPKILHICFHTQDRLVQGFELSLDVCYVGDWRRDTRTLFSWIDSHLSPVQRIALILHRLLTPCTFSLRMWSGVSCGLRDSRRDSMRAQLALMILNFVRNPRSVVRDPVRNPELHAGFNEGLGPRTGSVVQRGIQDEARLPEFRAGSNAGSWCSTWQPGIRAGSNAGA